MILNDYTEVEALIMSIAERAKEFVPQQMVQNYVYYLFKKKARWVPCYKTIEYPLIPNMPAQASGSVVTRRSPTLVTPTPRWPPSTTATSPCRSPPT